jgi:hypothetical protein
MLGHVKKFLFCLSAPHFLTVETKRFNQSQWARNIFYHAMVGSKLA